MSLNSIEEFIMNLSFSLKLLKCIKFILYILIFLVRFLNHLNDVSKHIWVKSYASNHPYDSENMFCWSMSRNITITNCGKGLESPMKCHLILCSYFWVEPSTIRYPSCILMAHFFIHEEPEASSKMCQEQNWSNDENDLFDLVSDFEDFRNSRKLWSFKHSHQFQQSEYSK